MSEPVYRLRDVQLERAGRVVLDIQRLDLESGKTTAIVGPNGSGKTTLLRLLALLVAPTRGTLELAGTPVSRRERDLRELRRLVSLVAQVPLLLHRSVRANLAYGLRARGQRPDRRIEESLAAVGLADFAERPAWKLSGGESQRVAIARATVIDPPVYLFDEPTANADREHVPVIEAVITLLGDKGRTVILTTHDLEQAYRLADTVLSLVSGRITTAPLLNVLRGTTVQVGDARYFQSQDIRLELTGDGQPSAIAIDPADILVSRSRLQSSARNSLGGMVARVEHDGSGVLLTVSCAGRPVLARITRSSYDQMGLNIGTEVWLTFKASAIHVLDESTPERS
jgi:tungstate transport system ATP-binding protein